MTALNDALTQRFRDALTRQLGLTFDETKGAFLSELMARRAEATRRTLERYLVGLESRCDTEERRALALDLTVPETYFFRHMDQMRALSEAVLPERRAARAKLRRLRLLSAGCASGEEPYSLAILVRDAGFDASWETSVQALDMNPAALEKARRGRYSSWALRETPEPLAQRWFARDGREFVLDASIRAAVEFRESNLVKQLFEPESYDVIFCRNVIMYFAPEIARALIARFTAALTPGGYLFLGHAETLRGLSGAFHLCHTHGTFYYQRRDALETATVAAQSSCEFDSPAVADDAWAADAWVETVQRAAARIKALTDAGAPQVESAPARPPANARAERACVFDLSGAFELLKSERFQEALARVSTLPGEARHDPDVLLLKAALLTHAGQLAEARRTCDELLAIDELNSGAHYLLALCCEGSGDPAGALDHDQVSMYLDATFAMPHVHLGLMARRSGDWATARRELEQAISLLRREDPARLLLFGGGFGRDTLLALCQAELALAGRA